MDINRPQKAFLDVADRVQPAPQNAAATPACDKYLIYRKLIGFCDAPGNDHFPGSEDGGNCFMVVRRTLLTAAAVAFAFGIAVAADGNKVAEDIAVSLLLVLIFSAFAPGNFQEARKAAEFLGKQTNTVCQNVI